MGADLTLYWQEFLIIASAHAIAIVSPGPDFAVVLRNSLVYGRQVGLMTSLGIGLAIMIHVAYSIVAVGLLMNELPTVFYWVKIAGALYLLYLGYGAIRSTPQDFVVPEGHDEPLVSNSEAFRQGFITNVFNPKATVFFLSLFSSLVSVTTPVIILAGYGIWMSIISALWFAGLSMVLGQQRVRSWFARYTHWVNRVLGLFFIGLAAAILLNL